MRTLFPVFFTFILLASCSNAVTVTNFEECIAAGNPIMESYPRQCRHGEQIFTEELDEPVQPPLVGGDRDEHGCLGAAGYTWCEAQEKCLRVWEEQCYTSPEENIAFELAMKYEKTMEDVHVTLNEKTATHAKGGVKFSSEKDAPGGLVLATKINDVWRVVFDGNGSVDCADLTRYDFPATMMEGVCD